MSKTIIPLVIFIGLVILLAVGLSRDPRVVPSPLIGKSVPAFELPQLHDPQKTFGTDDLKGQVSLLNVWGSWCVSCRVEHPLLLQVAQQNLIPIYGLNYKDTREDAINWLDQLGDPYSAVAFDAAGEVGIDLGVYGAPETYIIDRNGMIAYKHIGPISGRDWREKFLPVIQQLKNVKS
ncbi:MAG TPA: DsbE family thiol:disulfide interchange protein [Gammaproteobacteria bacterium]